MTISLYKPQQVLIDQVRVELRTHRNVLMQLATGGGKTVIASFMAKSAAEKGKRLYFICHRSELIQQTHKTFSEVGIEHGFVAAGYTPDYHQPVQICSIDTLKRRYKDIPNPDLCLWDECHHLGAAGWSAVHEYYDLAFHIGLSATPNRLDGKGLGAWFDKMVCGPSISWLIENGYLSDYIFFAPSSPDLSGVGIKMGDFKKDDLYSAVDKPKLTGDIIKHYLMHARGKKALMFAVNVKHSEHLVAEFKANGIMAIHLDGKTPKGIRKQASIDFAKGHIDVLSNVGLFGEGYDLAAQSGMDVNIECVIDAAPTQSLSLCMQKWGRSLRRKGYPAIILDHAGNWTRHGLPDDDREWSLDGVKNQGRKRQDEPNISVNQCPTCFCVHEPAPMCPQCGYVYIAKGREIEHEDGELVEISKEQRRIMNNREQAMADSLDDLIALGVQRGYTNPVKWASHVFTARLNKQRMAG